MFYLLSKILLFAVSPLAWVLFFLLIHCIRRRVGKGKKSLIIAISLLLFFGNDKMADVAFQAWEYEGVALKSVPELEWAIVLGGVTKQEQTPTDRVHFATGADRVLHAALLWQKGKVKKILVTGGIGNPDSSKVQKEEALAMAEFLRFYGVPDSVIFIEKKARNTRENAIFTSEMLRKYPSKVILVTSAFHMKRAVACYQKVGLNVYPFPTDFRTNPTTGIGSLNAWIPSSTAIGKWEILLKEIAGLLTYKLMGYA